MYCFKRNANMSTQIPAYKCTRGNIICKSHKLQTTQKFTNTYMFTDFGIFIYYSAIKRTKTNTCKKMAESQKDFTEEKNIKCKKKKL